ncbi:hypothetical protein CAP36_00350 [Chitinophagaceae bacterium IBVUCB2]|nr:hypothetical protein CAP36_00350 [Chitinophagaceae bacterium IBVUCB2]
MKLNLLPIFLALACVVILASFRPMADAGIKVNITNLRSNKGHVLISLFKDGEGYPDKPEKAFKKAKLAIINKNATLLFEGLPAGTYAIAILHDENDDAKMNTNMLGLPKEGYGFSNNVMGAFGPPAYNKASFKFTANAVITTQIKARY